MLPYIMNYRMDPPGYMSSPKLRASVLAEKNKVDCHEILQGSMEIL